MIRLRLGAALAACIALASCGGGGSGSAPSFVAGPTTGAPAPPNPASGPTAPPSLVGTASLSILIPNATSTSSLRRTAYVSPVTKSVAVFAAPTSATPPPTATTVANVGAGAPGCTSVSAGTTCTITVPAQYGQMTFTIKTYDGVLGTGNLLSSATIVQIIGPNQAPIPVSLSGVVAGVTLALSGFSVPAGGGTLSLAVNATDANGAVIGGGGSYSVPITLSASDPSVTFSPAVITGPGQTVTVTYSAATSSIVTINAVVQGISANAIQSATFSVSAPAAIASTAYVLSEYPTAFYEFPAGSNANIAPSTRFSPVSSGYVEGFAADSSGHVAISQESAPNYYASINIYASNGTFVQNLPLPHTPPSGDGYLYTGGLTFDASGNLVVAIHGYQFSTSTQTNEIDTFAAGSSTPIRSIAGSLANVVSVQQISADASGRLFALQTYPTTAVYVYPAGANGNVAPITTITPVITTSNYASALAVAADGTIAVLVPLSYGGSSPGQLTTGEILVYSPSGTLLRTITGGVVNLAITTYTTGMAFDANDNLYVPSANAVYVFGPTASANATPIRTFGGSLVGGTYFNGIALGTATSTNVPTSSVIKGDMLALAPNRTWNYSGVPAGGTPFTVSLYNDPQPVSGNTALVLFAKSTAGTDAIPADGGTLAAAAGLTSASDGYHAQTYGSVSNDSYGLIPGGPLLVLNTLTLGQTFVPFPGITATVTFIGAVPGMSACTNSPTAGATVVYAVYGGTETVSYVPGCGVTNVINDAGTTFTLTSIASHPEIGEQSFARHVLHATYGDTLRTLWQRVLVRH